MTDAHVTSTGEGDNASITLTTTINSTPENGDIKEQADDESGGPIELQMPPVTADVSTASQQTSEIESVTSEEAAKKGGKKRRGAPLATDPAQKADADDEKEKADEKNEKKDEKKEGKNKGKKPRMKRGDYVILSELVRRILREQRKNFRGFAFDVDDLANHVLEVYLPIYLAACAKRYNAPAPDEPQHGKPKNQDSSPKTEDSAS
jgi:hypothetical protein